MTIATERRPPPSFVAGLKARRKTFRALLDKLDKLAQESLPRGCAEIADDVRWLALAHENAVSIHTVQFWARKGRMPKAMAKAMEARYGKKAATVEQLAP